MCFSYFSLILILGCFGSYHCGDGLFLYYCKLFSGAVAKIALVLMKGIHSLLCCCQAELFLLFPENYCHFQQGVYNPWRRETAQGDKKEVENIAHLVSHLGSSKQLCLHLSVPRVTSAMCEAYWVQPSVAIQCRGVVQTHHFWAERRSVWSDKGLST